MITLNETWGFRTPRGFPMARSSIYNFFTNPFYYGHMESRAGTATGTHQPMITEAEFWRAQEILGRRGKPRPQRHAFAYTGLIRCGECGRMITAEHKMNRRYGYPYVYYHCTRQRRPCRQRVIEARPLEAQIATYLARLAIPPRVLDWVYDRLQDVEVQNQSSREAVEQNLRAIATASKNQLTTLTQLRTRNLITDAEFLEERRRLQAEIAGMQGRVSGGDEASATTATFEAFALAARAREWFLAGDPETKRQVLQIVGSNLLLADKILSIEAKTPFRLIDEGLAGLRTTSDPIEPPHSGLTMRDFVGLEGRKKEVWARVDDVRTFFQNGVGNVSLAHVVAALVTRLLSRL